MHRARAHRLEFPHGGVRTQVRLPRGRHGGGPKRGGLDGLDEAADEPGPQQWVAEHHTGRHCHRRPHPHPLRRKFVAAAALAGMLAAAALAVVRPPIGGANGETGAAGHLGALASADRTTAATAGVRDWVLANLEPATAALVPAEVADDLIRHGHQPGRLIVYDGGASLADWRCCRFLVTLTQRGAPPTQTMPTQTMPTQTLPTQTLQTMPPRLRPAADRSRLLAAFESGGRRAEIREIFAGDPRTARAALAADRVARQAAAAELAENPRLDLAPPARVALLAGDVDARVLLALTGITGKHMVAVDDFPEQPGEATTGVPRRSVHITRVDGRPVHPHDAATKDVQRFLKSQVPPYRPDAQPITRERAVRFLTVTFRAPSPVGLLAPGS